MGFRQLILALGVFLVLIAMSTEAREKKKNATFGKMKEIETLFLISQDLDENSAVYINFKENCYCSCRDTLWSCTDLNCKVNMKECENEAPIQEAGDQSRITPPAFSSYTAEEMSAPTPSLAPEVLPATPTSAAYANTKINPTAVSKPSNLRSTDDAPAVVRYGPRSNEW